MTLKFSSFFAFCAVSAALLAGCHHNQGGHATSSHSHASAADASAASASDADHQANHGHEGHSTAPEGKLSLSPELKQLLTEEMTFIQQGMADLGPAIATGDKAMVVDIATRMKESFILARKLKPEQMKELHNSLPPGFVKMDHDFHDFAGMLASAAKAGQWNVTPYLFYRLNEGCLNCHATYAQEKFPTLAGKATKFAGRSGSFPLKHPPMDADHTPPDTHDAKPSHEGSHMMSDHQAVHEKMHGKAEGKQDCPMMKDGKCPMHDQHKGHMGEQDCPMMKDGKCAMSPEECAAKMKDGKCCMHDQHKGHMEKGECPMMKDKSNESSSQGQPEGM